MAAPRTELPVRLGRGYAISRPGVGDMDAEDVGIRRRGERPVCGRKGPSTLVMPLMGGDSVRKNEQSQSVDCFPGIGGISWTSSDVSG